MEIGNNHLVLIRVDIIVVAALDHLVVAAVADAP
jgi:hypothetical protein